MNTATKNIVPELIDSIATVVEKVKLLQETSTTGNPIIAIEIHKLIHDETLFTKAQRPSALKAVNKQLGTKYSLVNLKRIVTNNTPKPTIHVDGLSGVAELPKATATEEQQQPAAAAAAVASTETGFALVGGVADKAERNQTSQTTTESNPEKNTMETLVSINAARREAAAAAPAAEAVAPVTAAPVAPAAVPAANDVPGKLTEEQYKSVLEQIGVTTNEQVAKLAVDFFAANPALAAGYDTVKAQYVTSSVKDKLGIWAGATEENTFAFLAYAKAVRESKPVAAPATITEKVMTTLRGDRASGFSSGVVAAAAAVLGGAAEMLQRGSITVGSSVGAAAGAAAGYFAAEATDKLMDSETGRYILAGSIGAVAGGLGSRLGRTVQDGFAQNAHADDVGQALPDLKRPQAPAPVDGNAMMLALF